MERRTAAKPYFKALANFPKHKEEIDVLPKKYHAVLARYVYSKDSYPVDEEDFFGNLVLYCIEADRATSGKNFYGRVFQIVEAALFKQRQEAKKLYNPYCVRRSETTAGPLKSDTLTAENRHPFRWSDSWRNWREDRHAVSPHAVCFIP